MARKPHPIFGYVARNRPAPTKAATRRNPHEPRMKAEEQAGILWQGAGMLAIEIRHLGDNRYTAVVTPRSGAALAIAEPLPPTELMQKLLAAGCNPFDIGDAFYKANPRWLSGA